MEAETAWMNLAVALGIGLLLGLERERRKGRGPGRGAEGIRTFALVALLGGLAMHVGGTAVVAVAGGFVALAAVVGYLRTRSEDPGLTTEVALVVAFLLGALAQSEPALAAGAGAAVTIVLAARHGLHAFARDLLSEEELHAALLLAACALIVLPIVPDRTMGPYAVLNPFTLWRLVVLVMAVSAAGYVALRLLGPRYGLPLAGLASGFVSSTMTIAVMGSRTAHEPMLRQPAVAGAALSTVATVIYTAAVTGATSAVALREVVLPIVFAGAAAVSYGGFLALRASRSDAPPNIERGRAFDVRVALGFAGAIAAFMLVAAALQSELGGAGVTLAAGLAGFADAKAGAIGAAALVASGRVPANEAVVPVLVALSTNTVSKAAAAVVWGRGRFAAQIVPGLLLVIGGAWFGYLVDRLV